MSSESIITYFNLSGQKHRLDGPAIENTKAPFNKEWYINDNKINVACQKEFEEYLEKLIIFI